MNKILLTVCIVVLLWCASASAKTEVYHKLGLTPEGWWLVYTNDQKVVAEVCGEPNNKKILGCARWPIRDPETYPVADCLIWIYTEDSDTPVDQIVAHEMRHCNEGQWHK